MIRVDGSTPIPGLSMEMIEVFVTEVYREIAPTVDLDIDRDKNFWFAFALMLAARYHPKMKPSKARSRAKAKRVDRLEVKYMKSVLELARMARNLQPDGKGQKDSMDHESIPKSSLERRKKQMPHLWDALKGNPDLAALICEQNGVKSRKSTKN